jgi:cytochrome c
MRLLDHIPRISVARSLPAPGSRATLLSLALSTLTLSAGALAADEGMTALAEKGRCLVCHAADEQRMGPSFNAIAERYGADAGARDTLIARMRSGGSGVWGPAPMPPVTPAQLNDEELGLLLDWILDSDRGA